jgi:outer membrane immunogenic protein
MSAFNPRYFTGVRLMLRQIFFSTVAMMTLTGAALAADLPSRKAPPVFVPPPIFTWTGIYIGGQIGYQWGTHSPSEYALGGGLVSGLSGYSPSGVIGGAHLGFNYQIQQFVLGVEGDVDGTSYRGSSSFLGGAPALFSSYSSRINAEGSIRGRVGVAWDRALFYATGGVAFADIRTSYVSPGTPGAPAPFAALALPAIPATPPGVDSFSHSRVGWTVGGGVEYAITNNWSVRAEYRYTDFGRITDPLVNTFTGFSVRTHVTDNAVRVGFSYKFDWYTPPAPVVAKY